jgi:hypothetical protein
MGSKSYTLTVNNWPYSGKKSCMLVPNVCSQDVTDCFTSTSVANRLPAMSFYRPKEINITGREIGSGPQSLGRSAEQVTAIGGMGLGVAWCCLATWWRRCHTTQAFRKKWLIVTSKVTLISYSVTTFNGIYKKRALVITKTVSMSFLIDDFALHFCVSCHGIFLGFEFRLIKRTSYLVTMQYLYCYRWWG